MIVSSILAKKESKESDVKSICPFSPGTGICVYIPESPLISPYTKYIYICLLFTDILPSTLTLLLNLVLP